MLRLADTGDDLEGEVMGDPVVDPAPIVVENLGPGSRYGERRRPSASGLAISVAIHLAIVPILLGLGHHIVVRHEPRLVAMDLKPPAPPPAAPERPLPKPEVVAPPPRIQLVREPSRVLTIPDIPVEPVVVAVPVSVPPAPPAPPAPPSEITTSDLGTRMISREPPRYPVQSRRKKEQGTVELLLVLGTDGAVEAISVRKSSGFARLDEAALRAVRKWRWAPTLLAGAPVRVRGVVEIPFVLQGA